MKVISVTVLAVCCWFVYAGGTRDDVAQTAINNQVPTLKATLENLIDQLNNHISKENYDELKIQTLKCEDFCKEVTDPEKAELKAEIAKANEAMNKAQENTINEKIKNAGPLTAVLFTNGLRNNQWEVIKDPNPEMATEQGSGDTMEPAPNIGIINQKDSGNIAGILLAAEAPLAYPKLSWMHGRIPVGAWFGVNLQTGTSNDIDSVDLAAGLSFSFLSESQITSLMDNSKFSLASSAKILVGAMYGNVTSLGGGLSNNDRFELGTDVPVLRNKEIKFTIGLGFRF